MAGLLSSPPAPPSNASVNASAAKAAYLLAVHEVSHGYAVAYVCIVLVCYTIGMSVLLTRHFRWAGQQPRLAVLYHAIVSRTASIRQRRGDQLAHTAPQVVVHEPQVSSEPPRGASVAAQLIALAPVPPPSPLAEPRRTAAVPTFQETDF
ncbi:uncharacterized protein LOC119107021 [Pollicipes pollicipes]|uniref:uncharacterized protein LOC119107021 n=1 Tax=Pollicipes pollicipes TaxID=41117 RepID=UPI001885866F|nr:uncharacterized protein LOC119107021 [Pollicipes pollicipes]